MLKRVIYALGWLSCRLLFTLAGRMSVKGMKNLPRSKGFIIASNHVSWNDPPLIGCAIPRRINYMAKKELFDIPVFGWLLTQLNVFPVDRGGSDLGAIRRAVNILKGGKILLMFPTGTRSHNEEEALKFKRGIGMISCLTQVPVVPCLVKNSDKLAGRNRMRVSFAEPVYPPSVYKPDDYEALTETIVNKIRQLRALADK